LTDFTTLLGYYTLGNSHGLSNGISQRPLQPQSASDGVGATSTATAIATERIKKDTGSNVVGTGGAGADADVFGMDKRRNSTSSCRVCQYLYRDDDDPIGGAICSFPSMEVLLPIPEPQQSEHQSNMGSMSPPPPVAHIGADGGDPLNQFHHPVWPVPSIVGGDENAGDSMPVTETNVSDPPNLQIPVMTTSIIDLSPTNTATTNTAPLPPNPIDQNKISNFNTDSTDAKSASPNEGEHTIASSLSTPTIWTRSSFPQAPPALLRSLSSSFSSLVDSRVRAWTLFLLRHSLSSGEKESRCHLLNLLATRSSIGITATVTTFTVLNDVETVDRLREEMRKKREMVGDNGKGKRGRKTEDCDMVLPVRFESVMDVSLQGRQLTVRFSAPGTIAANYHEDTTLITYALCKVDTKKLADSMVEQTRRVVFEAVASATSSSSPTNKSKTSTTIDSQDSRSHASTPATSFSKLGATSTAASTNFMTTLGRTVSFATKNQSQSIVLDLQRRRQQQQQYQRPDNEDVEQKMMITTESRVKVAKSALKLSSLLTSRLDLTSTQNSTDEENNAKLGVKKKQPSVVWKHDDEVISSNKGDPTSLFKRRKFGPSQPAMKRSNKSFGRPDANDFCSVRNATFAEFGCMSDRDAGGHLRRPDALQRAQAHEQTFGLRRSGGSNKAMEMKKNSGGSMMGMGQSLNHMNATFERGMNSPLSMSNDNHRTGGSNWTRGSDGALNGQQQQQQQPGIGVGNDGQKLPTGALGALSLRSQKSAQFERMLSMMQTQGGSNKASMNTKTNL